MNRTTLPSSFDDLKVRYCSSSISVPLYDYQSADNSVRSFTTLMSLTTLMLRSMVRLLTTLIGEPVAALSTLFFYSGLLPPSMVLIRMVRHELLDYENYLFRFLIDLMSCLI